MVTTDWSDLNRDGRRLEALIKMCNSHVHSELDHARKLGYLDRLIKLTHQKTEIVEIIMGMKGMLAKLEKHYGKYNRPVQQTQGV